MKALERSPADRFASADEFLQALVRLDSVPNLSLWSER
jgi:hypothetical protein